MKNQCFVCASEVCVCKAKCIKAAFPMQAVAKQRYKQILEEEQRSLARNKQLLEDIDRLEKQMIHFADEYKQSKEGLNQAKNKFLRYVKAVYPKWKEDVVKWREVNVKQSRKGVERRPLHPQYEVHSPSGNHCFNANGRSPFPSSQHNKNYGNSFEYSRHPRKHNDEIRIDGDGGPYMDRSGCPNDTTSYSNVIRYPDHRLRSSVDPMEYPGDTNARSFRGTELSWDEMAFTRDCSTSDIVYQRMYHSEPWICPQTTPPGMLPYSIDPYFARLPAPYALSRLPIPRYECRSHPHGLSYVNGDLQGFTTSYDGSLNTSLKRDKRGHIDQISKDVSLNARTVEYTGEIKQGRQENGERDRQDLAASYGLAFEVNEGGNRDDKPMEVSTNSRQSYLNQRKHSDVNSVHVEDIHGYHSAENELHGQEYSGYSGNPLSKPPIQSLRSSENVDGTRNDKSDENTGKTSCRLPHGKIQEGAESNRDRKQELFEDCERSHQLKGTLNSRMAIDDVDPRHLQQKSDEEITDRTTISENFDVVKITKSGKREYLNKPTRDIRVTPLIREVNGSFSKDTMKTDSISLPTIHQYEGHPRDIFSDSSYGETQDNRVERKHSKQKQNYIDVSDGALNYGRSYMKPSKAQNSGDISDYEQLKDVPKSYTTDVSNSQPQRQEDNEINEKQSLGSVPLKTGKDYNNSNGQVGPYPVNSEVAEGDDRIDISNNQSLNRTTDDRSLKREVSDSKTSVVEDLLGDDVICFELSDISDVDESKKSSSESWGSGNMKENNAGQAEIASGSSSGSLENSKAVDDSGMSQVGVDKSVMGYEAEQYMTDDVMARSKVERNGGVHEGSRRLKEQSKTVPPTKLSERKDQWNEKLETKKDDAHEQNSKKSDSHCGAIDSPNELSLPDGLKKIDSDHSDRSKLYYPQHGEIQADSSEREEKKRESGKLSKTRSFENKEKHAVLKEDSKSDSNGAELHVGSNKGEPGESGEDKEDTNGVMSDKDDKSKSGILEEVSLSSAQSSSESTPVQENNTSKRSMAKESMSYSADFEEDKSIPLSQSGAYQKMFSTVDVSDEGEDLEEDFLRGTMSEANTTATSSHNIRQTLQDAGATTRTKLGTKSSNAKPTLSLFSLEGRDDVGTSFGEEGLGVFSASWMSGVGSHSPPLSREKGGYIPVVGDVENKQEREESAKKQGPPEDEDREAKKETGKKLHECNTKSRIQAGFWSHSDSESDVDLQISHGANNNDDDDDFDFYS